jgi:hypothetical protein
MSQLLPDKFVPIRQSLVGQGAEVLRALGDDGRSIPALYVELRELLPHLTYDSFVLTLDFLYATGRINWNNELLAPRAG